MQCTELSSNKPALAWALHALYLVDDYHRPAYGSDAITTRRSH